MLTVKEWFLKLKQFDKKLEEVKVDTIQQDVSIERLIELGLTALDREIRNLTMASAKGKLDPAAARDLRDHLKLLFELKDREKDFLTQLTDEELQALLDKRKNESKSDSSPA